MPRLKSLPQRTRSLRPRLAFTTDAHGHSKQAEPWRKWYGSQRWKDLRWSVLLRDRFTCQRCKVMLGHKTSELVADHRLAHHGDAELFWDAGNLQCICKPCHDSAKQAEDKRGW